MHGSRRAAKLQPGDYDHEITLTITDDEEAQSQRATSCEGGGLFLTNTTSRLLSVSDRGAQTEEEQGQQSGGGTEQQDPSHLQPSASNGKGSEGPIYKPYTSETIDTLAPSRISTRPSIEIRPPSHDVTSQHTSNWDNRSRPRSREQRETAIDILYENERGGFLCGVALFAGAALGGLDPTPWTNAYHNPSPTDIHTAQVPDPSWEWVWPEWRINQQEGMDEGGWEYSFAFQKVFSWHGPKWWNSFVRRRAWIRQRAKRRPGDEATENMLAGVDYFHIRPSSQSPSSPAGSRAPSRAPSRLSMTQASSAKEEEKPDIEDIETLLQVLRSARIDRERKEAVENYVAHAIDLSELQDEMHEIMSLFIFQQSRRQLLSYLMQAHDESAKAWEKDKTPELKMRKEALDAATKHAEEEVCKLVYWSDVKQMAESGELRDVAGSCQELGTDPWQGLDKSAPEPPRDGKMPEH